ncbi:hypothetical protein P8605_49520, partial [Streptomyces sp. T-3]|nr:hypothetical protein [Streptomyces sp. T-3]
MDRGVPARLPWQPQVHYCEGDFIGVVQADRRRLLTQRTRREPQCRRGVPGVEKQQRPSAVAVVRDRALRGDGQLDPRPGRRAAGLGAEPVHAVVQ